ncbi:TonB-dependent receptor [Caulobacter sp. 17J80-11]|uniref:TonB-dependent receptor n=1 Tax=Caulobacter sp. 17J80-11 TaxID=2763502 RepID=UPI0016537954|nr:TonB-dependent receptor [Caulobacter sp. 17J80-11]MBC6981897.1 TonB-dependent receptor [Caulobacter sp. 17J80-11]
MRLSYRCRGRRGCLLAFAAAASLAAGAALAQEQAADGRTVYASAWFEQFAPSNAWDMASRVPGVNVQDGEDVRGFAGAAGNVVINGERPSAKAESLQSILSRIPAAQVVRVEIVPGQVIGGEYRSRAQVINVVLSDSADGWSGAAEATVRMPFTRQTALSGGVSALYRNGATSLNLAVDHYSENLPDEGFDLLTALPSGDLIERRDKVNRYAQRQDTLSASWAWEPSDGRAAHVNARVWNWTNPLAHNSRVSDALGPIRYDTINQVPERLGVELGADFSRPLAGGTAKLVGLMRRERYETDEAQLNHTPDRVLTGGFAQSVNNLYGETIGRGTWSHENLWGWSFETGAEVALNTLDADIRIASVDSSGVHTPIPFPGSQVLVEEIRGEAFVSGGRKLTPTLTFDWGAAIETSTISVEAADYERTLTFIKPRASLEWRPDDKWRMRLAVGRTAAQLNFDDFVSNVELATERENGGNVTLEPERTWRVTGEIERKVLGDGAVRLALNSDWVEMVQDRVPVEVLGPDGPDPDSDPDVVDVIDAPGNLGDGRRLWLEAAVGLPLDKFGVAGGRFNARWTLQDSRVRDPYTHKDRDFTFEELWGFSADFRQDLRARKLAWGVIYDAEGALPQYRLNEFDVYNPENTWFRVFVEARPNAQTTITLSANNVLDRALERDRDFYFPNRTTPDPIAHEYRWRTQGVTWALQAKRTFG